MFKVQGIGALLLTEIQPGMAGRDYFYFFDEPEGKIIFDGYGFIAGVINNYRRIIDLFKIKFGLR